ncbi:MAG: hypothetical protein QXL15_02470 [Candidatus Korarchaeota archaeon]
MIHNFEKPRAQTLCAVVCGIVAILPMVEGLHTLPALLSGILLPLYLYVIRVLYVDQKWIEKTIPSMLYVTSILTMAMGFGYHWFANVVNDFPTEIFNNPSIVNESTYWHDEILSHVIMFCGGAGAVLQVIYEVKKVPRKISFSSTDHIIFIVVGVVLGPVLADLAIGFGEPIEPQHWIFSVGSVACVLLLVYMMLRRNARHPLYTLMTITMIGFVIVYNILFIPYLV